MAQVARNLTHVAGGFIPAGYSVIHDSDPLYTAEFRANLKQRGVKTVRLPARSPNLNAYAERFVRSIEEECPNRIVPLGEGHLRSVVREFAAHCHEERNHQGLDNRLIMPPDNISSLAGRVRRRQRIGGLSNYYYRDAA